MNGGLWAGAALLAAVMVAPGPARADDEAVVAPPDEAGWKVVRFPNGYLRYQPDPGESTDDSGQGGRVFIVPAQPLPPGAPPPAPTPGGGAWAPAAGPDACHEQRARLAQRLMQLRGVELDPESALVVLEAEQEPYRPPLALPWPSGSPAGTALAAAVSYDTPARMLLADLARCRYPRPADPGGAAEPAAQEPRPLQTDPMPVTPASASTHSR